MSDKIRLDTAVFEAGLAESREKAKAMIMEGIVYVNNQKEDKPGTSIKADAKIEVRGSKLPFASRGGLKLDKAVKVFGLKLADKICMDVGASHGGFTDCMLQNGAAKVYAVDVGYGQLVWKLRSDPRVVNMERTNIRYVTPEQVADKLDFASVDVSFISLTLVVPVVRTLLRDGGEIMCLIKPQFEAGKGKVGKKGVVRDPVIHREVIEKILALMEKQHFQVLGLDYSPIKGPEGNIEYLIYARKEDAETSVGQEEESRQFDAAALVEASHTALGG
ncbi:MAG: TlyA family RNA methyltransferase [Clostridia bacterium]|nr:TlyA family RNA methyltransferase [Clostridia bacterium]MBQ5544102.1 TlyA family RNA methyltransferase [Clostridia bacterium]